MSDSVLLDISEGVAIITLNQAKRGNPIDLDFCDALTACVDQIEADDTVRAVLLRADGNNFSFGGDIKMMQAGIDDLPGQLNPLFPKLNPALARIYNLGIPVVAQVQGYCVGGGLGIAAQADVVVAGEGAKFGAAFTGIGLSNDSGSTYGLATRVGIARARKFYLLNEMWPASQALDHGLADLVVPDEELAAAALDVARQLAAGPTLAYRHIKAAFAAMVPQTFEEAAQREADNMAVVSASEDAKEGVSAMNEKRKPSFGGR